MVCYSIPREHTASVTADPTHVGNHDPSASTKES